MRLLIIETKPKAATPWLKDFDSEEWSIKVTPFDRLKPSDVAGYDAVILDIERGNRSTAEFCRTLREHGVTVPVVVLTASTTPSETIRGLDAGADDYLIKPVEMVELKARIHALARRANQQTTAILRHGDLELDLVRRIATRGRRKIGLTTREFEILKAFMHHPGVVLCRKRITSMVWRQGFPPDSNVIDVYISGLRKKVDEDGKPQVIRTVIGYGYVLDASRGDET
jgi:DNA-binding response OmpR family regulator